MNQTGSNLAFTNSGNLILITPVDPTKTTLQRWALCNDKTFLDEASGECQGCKSDTNNCENCLKSDICLSCPTQSFLTDAYQCQSCATINIPGCKTCQEAGKCLTCFDD